ncbi:hypothetical protein M2347_001543 [Chryseobacterium sp. H1D6B]|uniref:hypothetical protein n=1 Tax=Chryseobacterium sp. H1D6B TaxID=2940588 RepID=UPI0015C99554|nr:hypothetical protein [Chryseobacterium sp. H1D6B]MDH6251816.1 hypothetical protein [Chryseobacterium sp. H1D6B]
MDNIYYLTAKTDVFISLGVLVLSLVLLFNNKKYKTPSIILIILSIVFLIIGLASMLLMAGSTGSYRY